VRRLEVKWDVEPLIKVPTTMLVGIVLVIISFNVALPISQLSSTVSRGTLGIALASRDAGLPDDDHAQQGGAAGDRLPAMENGLFLAATSATYGMPMVVELGIALDVLVGVHHPRRVLLPDPRAVRQPRHPPPGAAEGALMLDLFVLVLAIPLASGARCWRWRASAPGRPTSTSSPAPAPSSPRPCSPPRSSPAGRASSSASLLHRLDERLLRHADRLRRHDHQHLLGPYMRNEREHGRLSAPRLRLYKSMFQLFMFTMLAALTTNNLGILWVAMEAATLTTVLLVSLYRTPASLEAAWKYFILCGVGIAQALFGTILLYFAAERVLGRDRQCAAVDLPRRVKGQLDPTIMALAFIFLLVGYGTKVGLVPLHNWLPDAHAEGPTPVSAVLSGLLLNVALYAILRCKVLADGAIPVTSPAT
jgi:hypothetical protein